MGTCVGGSHAHARAIATPETRAMMQYRSAVRLESEIQARARQHRHTGVHNSSRIHTDGRAHATAVAARRDEQPSLLHATPLVERLPVRSASETHGRPCIIARTVHASPVATQATCSLLAAGVHNQTHMNARSAMHTPSTTMTHALAQDARFLCNPGLWSAPWPTSTNASGDRRP